ncbi:hypothetical protein RI129_005611 [Pyrocoelia pectoralis]|uniref:Cytochrome b5 heme-binding domain-containing protein n=1 Tax=Pyrocoelia pectoralis TaxID=417401 RepID=A0AAN7VFS1_9COLE
MTLFQLLISLTILILGLILSIYNENIIIFLNNVLNRSSKTENLLTPEELTQFNGETKSELYLAILGNIFDVSKGSKHYGPGETYHIFVGRDSSRSFITGKFKESESSDDVIGLTNNELISLDNWLKFYEKQYPKVGKVIGRYYDENGEETQYYQQVKEMLRDAVNDEEELKLLKVAYPPCNIEWDVNSGTRVWCTKRSGGVERNWIGFPRKLYEPGSHSFRCACIKEEDLVLPNLQEYEGCISNYVSCNVKTANV